MLKREALSGVTVVFTIHQPSSEIFHLFDRLILLAEGRLMYQGPSRELVPYLDTIGL